MANKDIATVNKVVTLTKANSVFVEVGGSVRRITIDDLMNLMNKGDDMLLRQVAWGVPCHQTKSQNWGVVGNRAMFEEYVSKIGRYLVAADGKAAKLSPTNSAEFADGTPVSELEGQVMVIAPRLYYVSKTEDENGVEYAWFSSLPIGGAYFANCNNDEHICIGAYLASGNAQQLFSRSNNTPVVNESIRDLWGKAQAIGKGWGLMDYKLWQWVAFLGLTTYGNPNIQHSLGYGVGGSRYNDNKYMSAVMANIKTGATRSYGDATCVCPITSISNTVAPAPDACHTSLYGIEDFYGWLEQIVQGIYCGYRGTEMFCYEGNRLPATSELNTSPKGAYRSIKKDVNGGWNGELALGANLDLIQKSATTGSSYSWGDYQHINGSGQLVTVGGSAKEAPEAGLTYMSADKAYDAKTAATSTRLAYYGPLCFVSGANF